MKFSIKNDVFLVRKSPVLLKNLKKWVAVLTVALFPFLTSLSAEGAGKEESPKFNAREVFANLHTPGLEQLSKTTRLDMADYWEADSVFKVAGSLGGASWLEALTADYARVRVTPVSTVEIKILPYKKDKIVACLFTVGDSVQAKDTEVNFYDASLRPLNKKKFFSAPDLSQFFEIPKGSSTSMKEIREMVPFPTVAYSLSPENTEMTARLTVEDYINPDDWHIIRLFLKKDLKAIWKGKYKFGN
ncbi:MAG: DUF3256 family protein [Muribaculaceae bacterium]|nr:DUF3256 family protein [Muribaculaceae bacterium]